MLIGVALSGGALRGVAHIGVLKAFEEAQVPISYISGTSSGALVAGAYASGLTADQMQAEALRLDDRMLDFNSLGAARAVVSHFAGRRKPFSGLMRGDAVLRLAEKLTGGISIDRAPMRVAICTVDITSGKTVYFTNEPRLLEDPHFAAHTGVSLAEAVTASTAIPGVFVPRRIHGRLLVDGGVTDYVPAEVLRPMGAEYVISVDLGREQYAGVTNEDITHVITRSYEIMSRSLVDSTLRDSDMVISPYVADIGLFEFSRAQECIDRGYHAAKKLLPTIKATLFARERQRGST